MVIATLKGKSGQAVDRSQKVTYSLANDLEYKMPKGYSLSPVSDPFVQQLTIDGSIQDIRTQIPSETFLLPPPEPEKK